MGDRLIQSLALGVLVVALVIAGSLAREISRERQDRQLVVSFADTRGLPPNVALATAALGSFRGLAVDALWMRADALQEEGLFFEAQTLAQWITALQPRFPRVWAFQAWNLAYNISVATTVPEERWIWITRGMDLLRTRGIPLNPDNADLPQELGWLYFHKIGGKSDREHWYYKSRLAREFREILGDPTGGVTTAVAIERFATVARAADSLAELADRPGVARAIELLREHAAAPDENLLRLLGRAVMFGSSVDTRIRFGSRLPADLNPDLIAALQADEPARQAVFEQIVPHLQKRVLVDRYRMDPDFMLELMTRYGPLDWAHPHAHGMYWSERGIAVAAASSRRDGINELTLIRTRLGNLQYLMRSGRVEFDPGSGSIDLLPDPRFIAGYEAGIRDAILTVESDRGLSAAEFGRATVADLLGGYESFLQQATVFAYLYGDEDQAEESFVKLCQIARDSGRADSPLYAAGLQGFLALKLADVMQIEIANLRQFLDAMLRRAFLDGLATGRLDTFQRFVQLAHTAYDKRYKVTAENPIHVNPEARLPPFPRLVENSFENVMRKESIPLLVRARIWAWAPESLRVPSWGDLQEPLWVEAEARGFDPARAFPEPAEPMPPPSTDRGRADSPVHDSP